MKKYLLLLLLTASSNIKLFAQPTYIIDSTAFNAITLDGGLVQAHQTTERINGQHRQQLLRQIFICVLQLQTASIQQLQLQ